MITEVEHVGRNWWLFVVLGAICIITGIVTVVWPGITLLTLGILAGIYLMVAAIMEIVDAVTGDPGGRALSAILGIVALIAGLIFIRRPGESLLAIVIVAGIFLVAEGVIRIVRAFSGPGTRWWGVAAGLFDGAAGIVILAWPQIGIVTLAVFFAITMIVRGALAIVLGFKIRNLKDLVDEQPVHTMRATTA